MPKTARYLLHCLKGLLCLAVCALVPGGAPRADGDDDSEFEGGLGPKRQIVRFATFNASLNRDAEGELIADLALPDDPQAQAVAEIVQRVRPDVLLINEFDYDEAGEAVRLFKQNYLQVSQNGAEPISYRYVFLAPSNTGVPSGIDLDNDGLSDGPGDAYGFGVFPGQFAMVLLSKHPIWQRFARTFQTFRWKDMPGALLPVDPETGESFYSEEQLAVFRLSSKSHWDVPVVVGRRIVHVLASHPTPPVFDGPEDRNGTRNHDEIRFWSDYVRGGLKSLYIRDDRGRRGGLWPLAKFVIMGDQNADPFDGDSVAGAAQQLLDNPRIEAEPTPSSEGGVEQAILQNLNNDDHLGDPAFDTADFSEETFGGPGNLRVDYVLPSKRLKVVDSGVFWPTTDDPLFRLVGPGFPVVSSDHRLVWVDIAFPRRRR